MHSVAVALRDATTRKSVVAVYMANVDKIFANQQLTRLRSSAKRARQLWDRCVLSKHGKRKVADIQRADVTQLITAMADTPATANKVISLLSNKGRQERDLAETNTETHQGDCILRRNSAVRHLAASTSKSPVCRSGRRSRP